MNEIIEVDVMLERCSKKMKALRISKNLCLLKSDAMRGAMPFVRCSGELSLTHIQTGLKICIVKGSKEWLFSMASELESISDLSVIDTSALTEQQKDANHKAVSKYYVSKP